MEIIKLLKDYSKTPLEYKLNEYMSNKFDTSICREPIKNKEYLLQYVKPLNDFVIHTTAMPCMGVRRI